MPDCQSWRVAIVAVIIIVMNKNIKKKLGKNIKKLRQSNKLTQEELSLELNLDWSYIGKVENAKMNITIDKIIQIADYFKVPVKNLFE